MEMGSHESAMALLKSPAPKSQLQDALVKTPAKKSPMVLRMLALASAVTCSVCIFSVLVKRLETHSETHVVRKASPIAMAFNLSKNSSTLLNASYVAGESLAGKRLPLMQKIVNFTPVGSFSEVRVGATQKTLSQVVTINSSEKTLSQSTRLNLTEKQSLDPKFRQSRNVNYNKTATNHRQVQKCMPVSLYAIVSMQRSGSKWLEALLNSHENIRSHGEIFYNVDRKCNMTVITRVLDRVYSLNWNISTFRRKRNKCLVAVGFKWMLNQGVLDNHEGIVDYFNRRGVSAILLLRKNLLRRLVSVKANNHDGHDNLLNGTHKAHVSSKEEAQILASYKPKLDVKRLVPTLQHMEKLAADTLEYFKNTRHIVVYYEDLVQNQTKKMMDVLDFLRVPQRSLVSGHVKIHTRPLEQQIANWRAVVKVIRRSKFKRFIAGKDYEI